MGIFKSLTGGMKAKVIASIIALPVIVTSGIGMGFANDLAFNRFSTTLTTYLCVNEVSDGATAKVPGMGNELAVEIEREGMVLLKNDGVLPLSKDEVKKVNVFGFGSVDWYIMSSGSEMVGTKGHTRYEIVNSLQEKGIEVNTEIQDYYLKWHKAEGDSNTISTALDEYYKIREPSLETSTEYQAVYEKAKAYSDTALFVISRHAGENSDCPHYQNKVMGTTGSGNNIRDVMDYDYDRTYLEISTEEQYAIERIANDFENVIIIINSTNNMTLDFVDEIDGIDACLSVGVTGGQGALAIPEILWGDVSPSGHLTDTISYRPEYNITYFRSSAKHTRHYTGGESSNFYNTAGSGSGGTAFYKYACYVEYTEGIYVGYRWFETADAEGFWDTEEYGGYENVVQYPFGYGLSYTTFDWELKNVNIPDGSKIGADEKIEITVEVKNTGEMPGKDVVQVYLTAPYTPGGIEKSSVKLVGFGKSPELQPGQVSEVKIEVRTSDFKSYDDYDANDNGFTGYELEKGNYQLKLMTDAHNIKEMNKNTLNYNVPYDVKVTNDEVTGREVRNLFTGDDAYEGMPIDGSSVGQNVEYVHRNEFPPLLKDVEEDKPWDNRLKDRSSVEKPVSNYSFSKEMSDVWDNATGLDVLGDPIPDEMPTWGSGGSLRLIEKGSLTEVGMACAADYNDPLWDDVLDQIKFDNAKTIVTMNSSYAARGIAEIGLRTDNNSAFDHEEGASMIGGGYGQGSGEKNCPAYPGPTMVCQAWNKVLSYNLGKSQGNDMNAANADAIYSPNCNIHRSTYGGRNCGYQSEDPYLSGTHVSQVVRGIGVYGKTTFVKHFVCNDQDFNRMALFTWCTEQALREIYLRPFEEAVKVGDTTGIMTSFNRVGGIWAGGNEALIQGVLRREWGFKGQIITDMTENPTNMDIGFHFRYGGNINLILMSNSTVANAIGTAANTPVRVQNRLREAMHEIAYSYTHSLWKNATYNASADPQDAVVSYESKQPYVWWKPAVVSLDAFVYGGLVIGGSACVLTLLKAFRKKEEN